MKRFDLMISTNRPFFYLLLCLTWTCLTFCSNGSDPPVGESIEQTGSIAFRLTLVDRGAPLKKSQAMAIEAEPEICGLGVTDVEAVVYYEGG